ncbi:MAG: hypothetical protein ACJ8CG_02445 [Microvirga sp.]
MVPIRPKASWNEAKTFAAGVAAMTKASPALHTETIAKRARTGRIFVDDLRNGRGARAVAAYSTRARAGASVSTPIVWDKRRPSAVATNIGSVIWRPGCRIPSAILGRTLTQSTKQSRFQRGAGRDRVVRPYETSP